MFAARQGEAARPPDVSGRNGAPVETQIERLDHNGDSFSSKFNDRNVSPAGLRGTADEEHRRGAVGMQPSTRLGSRGGRSYGGAGLVARRAPRGGSSIRSCAVRERESAGRSACHQPSRRKSTSSKWERYIFEVGDLPNVGIPHCCCCCRLFLAVYW